MERNYTLKEKIAGEMAIRRMSSEARVEYIGGEYVVFEIDDEKGKTYDFSFRPGSRTFKGHTFEELQEVLENLFYA